MKIIAYIFITIGLIIFIPFVLLLLIALFLLGLMISIVGAILISPLLLGVYLLHRSNSSFTFKNKYFDSFKNYRRFFGKGKNKDYSDVDSEYVLYVEDDEQFY